MQKCFVISLHRTGTRSTAHLLKALGMRTAQFRAVRDLQKSVTGRETDHDHLFKVLKPIVESVDAVADVPFPVLYPLLAREYPTAKFVLLHRDPWEWAASVRAHIGNRPFHEFERAQYWHYFPSRPARVRDIAVRKLIQMHVRHTSDVSTFFDRHDRARLLSVPLASTDTASAISGFLGYQDPPQPMPQRGKQGRPARHRFRQKLSAYFLRLLMKDATVIEDR